MSSYLTSQQFLRIATVVFVMLAAAVAVIQSRRGEDAVAPAPSGRGEEADTLVGELARCRTVTSDNTAGLDACRHIWAENRQRFFVSTRSPQLPAPPAPNAPAVLMKSDGRVPPREVDLGRAQ
jgi:conjugative transfer region protein TrbK